MAAALPIELVCYLTKDVLLREVPKAFDPQNASHPSAFGVTLLTVSTVSRTAVRCPISWNPPLADDLGLSSLLMDNHPRYPLGSADPTSPIGSGICIAGGTFRLGAGHRVFGSR